MNLLFDFTVDKATSTIFITREFAADLDLVWDAFTNAEILDKWMGPKPYRVQTKEMDFRVGGRWLYTMVSRRMSHSAAIVWQSLLKSNPRPVSPQRIPLLMKMEILLMPVLHFPLPRTHSKRTAKRPPCIFPKKCKAWLNLKNSLNSASNKAQLRA